LVFTEKVCLTLFLKFKIFEKKNKNKKSKITQKNPLNNKFFSQSIKRTSLSDSSLSNLDILKTIKNQLISSSSKLANC
jgi:hypothetical protein